MFPPAELPPHQGEALYHQGQVLPWELLPDRRLGDQEEVLLPDRLREVRFRITVREISRQEAAEIFLMWT